MGIHISQLGRGEITYTHQDPDTKVFKTFAVQRIKKWIAENADKVDLRLIPVDKEFAKFIENNRGIEAHRLLNILLSEAKELDPIILAQMPDKTCLIIDGNHRYVAASKVGARVLAGYIVSPEQWEPFLVDGISNELSERVLTGWSGL